MFVTPGKKVNLRFGEIRTLASELRIHIQTKINATGCFSRGLNNED